MATSDLVECLKLVLQRHPAPRYWIAYSGGLDSHVLAHLCARIKAEGQVLDFQALHVHHGLQDSADVWSGHCAQVCHGLGLPFWELRVDARARPGESPEEAARLARYGAIRAHIQAGDVVLAAQHRDDQAETLLLQLMRGAGLAGLSAMPEIAPLSPGLLLRPLLGLARAQLRDYALAHGLCWVEDPSNRDIDYDRNFLRQEIIPRLEQRWPSLGKSLSRSAGHCAEARQRLGDLALDLCHSALNADGESLSVAKLQAFQTADQRWVLREWLRMRGFRMPSQAVIGRILAEVLPARQDKMPIVSWREGEVRRYRDGLYVLPPLSGVDRSAVLVWQGQASLELPDGNGKLATAKTAGQGLDCQAWERGPVTVRYRQGGERCRLPGRSGTHELKKLFQESGIPPWLRDRVPLVYLGDELAAVGGWWLCEPFAGHADVDNLAIVWTQDGRLTGKTSREE